MRQCENSRRHIIDSKSARQLNKTLHDNGFKGVRAPFLMTGDLRRCFMCSADNAGKWEGWLLVYNQGLCFQPGANLNQVPDYTLSELRRVNKYIRIEEHSRNLYFIGLLPGRSLFGVRESQINADSKKCRKVNILSKNLHYTF
jgi:hypothetical protein